MRKYPVDSIVVEADGELLIAVNGDLGGSAQLIKIVKRNVSLMREIQLVEPYGSKVLVSLEPDDLLGITAALMSAKPGRSRILEAPPEVKTWLTDEYSKFGEPDSTESFLQWEQTGK